MHTASNMSGHALGDSRLTATLAQARSQSAAELQQAVAEANSLAAQAAEAQNRAQHAGQVAVHGCLTQAQKESITCF